MSPDDITLVDASSRIGLSFRGIFKDSINLEYKQQDCSVIRKYIFEYTSQRKKGSVVVKDNDGSYKMYIKGADSEILSRLSEKNNNKDILEAAESFIKRCSNVGLRAMLLAIRVYSPNEFQSYECRMKEAELDIAHKTEKMNEIIDEMERHLIIIGGTAMEDKLQDNVPKVLKSFKKAGISVWMLTGDKLETAESIGKSCNLLPQSSDDQIKKFKNGISAIELDTELAKCALQKLDRSKNYLIIETDPLAIAMKNKRICQNFVKYAKQCSAVICCRAGPSQKAEVVRAVKLSSTKDITLSIGDGANDCSMLLEAHIGVGIYGKEGMRAVQSSDFAIGEFQCLWPLLMKHGRISYIRNAEMILYFFLKNLAFTLPQFFFCFFCSYSGQTVFEDMLISLFNLVFTSLPLAIKACFDVDVFQVFDMKSEGYKLYPYLYHKGQYDNKFTFWIYMKNLLKGISVACIDFFLPLYFYYDATICENGNVPDVWMLSALVYTSIIISVTIILVFTNRIFNYLVWIGYFVLSILWYFVYFAIANSVKKSILYNAMTQSVTSPVFFLSLIFIVMLVMGIFYFIRSYEYLVKPTVNEISTKMIQQGADKQFIKRRIKAVSATERKQCENYAYSHSKHRGLVGLIEG